MRSRTPLQIRIGLVILKYREAKNFTQEGFADRIEMHRAYYGALENGKRIFSSQHSNGSARGWASRCRKLFRKPNGSEGVFECTDTDKSQIAQSDLR